MSALETAAAVTAKDAMSAPETAAAVPAKETP